VQRQIAGALDQAANGETGMMDGSAI